MGNTVSAVKVHAFNTPTFKIDLPPSLKRKAKVAEDIPSDSSEPSSGASSPTCVDSPTSTAMSAASSLSSNASSFQMKLHRRASTMVLAVPRHIQEAVDFLPPVINRKKSKAALSSPPKIALPPLPTESVSLKTSPAILLPSQVLKSSPLAKTTSLDSSDSDHRERRRKSDSWYEFDPADAGEAGDDLAV